MIPASRDANTPWDDSSDPLWLLTHEEFEQLDDGTVVECITGKLKTKGVDYIDQDTRFGMIAWGLRESVIFPEQHQERVV